MSTLSKLFSDYTGGGYVAKNGKFSTTKTITTVMNMVSLQLLVL